MERYKVAIITIGCRANQADSAKLTSGLDKQMVEVVNDASAANMVVVNTCCVTMEAERDCRKNTRRALGASKDAQVIITGCALSANPNFGADIDDRVKRMGGGDADPVKLAGYINKQAGASIEPTHGISQWALGRTRALLKIQNGCTHMCSYCIVPFARGPERSEPRDKIIREATELSNDGFSEIVFTGVQIGSWGNDLPGKPKLGNLLIELAQKLAPGRIRLSSIEPWSVDDSIIQALAHHRICSHLHMPLQSGDDQVLQAMRRGYSSKDYLEIIEKVRANVPDIAIGTDVIAGFPGESEQAFQNTIETLKKIAPAYIHAFPYSPRPGTKAEKLPDRPPKTVAKDRVRKLRELAQNWQSRYRQTQIDQIRQVLVEEEREGQMRGTTDNFLPATFVQSSGIKPGQLVSARLDTIENDRFLASLVKK